MKQELLFLNTDTNVWQYCVVLIMNSFLPFTVFLIIETVKLDVSTFITSILHAYIMKGIQIDNSAY
jgi:hypothetical protein